MFSWGRVRSPTVFRSKLLRVIDCSQKQKPQCRTYSTEQAMGEVIKKQQELYTDDRKRCSKITVVGAGQVGMACVASLLLQKVTNDICVIDAVGQKAVGEALDLNHGSLFLKGLKISGGGDFKDSANSRIVVVTAGARQKEGEDRLALIARNIEIFKKIIPQLVQNSPEAIFLIVSNPVDVLTYATWKISNLPKNRVIGSGTNLDSSRFRYLLAKKFNVSPGNVHAVIIGEHGDSSVPVWSTANVAGVTLRSIHPTIGLPEDKEEWHKLHRQVVDGAYDVIKLKGYTNWAIGLSTAQLCHSFITDAHSINPVSTLVKDIYGISDEVYTSLPCVIGSNGIYSIVQLRLTDHELKLFTNSAKTLFEIQKKTGL